MSVGLLEEDIRFGQLYEAMQGSRDQHYPTVACYRAGGKILWAKPCVRISGACWRSACWISLTRARRFIESELKVPGLVWDAARGETPATLAPGMVYYPPERLVRLEDLIVPDELRSNLASIPHLFELEEIKTLILRGPQHNGRRTTLGAVARLMGRGLIEIQEYHLPPG